jgi:hypothetical protein
MSRLSRHDMLHAAGQESPGHFDVGVNLHQERALRW